MTDPSPDKAVLAGTKRGHKTYTFNDGHDPSRPAMWWFQESTEGRVLFLVFYSLACRWSRCLGCSLPAEMSQRHVDYKALMSQVDHICGLDEVVRERGAVRKVILSNNGSIFDEKTFSTTALVYLLAKLNMTFPRMESVSIETRAEYVDLVELEVIERVLREGETESHLEIAIGVEAFDDHIRNEIFDKGLPRRTLEKLVGDIAPYGYRLKCYFMLKPVPGMSDEAAILDIHGGIDYLDGLARRHGVRINMHLNPTYAARGTPLEEHFRRGDYVPPSLRHLVQAALHGLGRQVSIFLGLNDEGLAVEGGSFLRPGDEGMVGSLEEFNRTGDYDILARLDL